jgi:tetratricopeptide (TPR) repeat protein
MMVIFAFMQIATSVVSAQDAQQTWSISNDNGIKALRAKNYAEAQQLFQQALRQCTRDEDRAVVNDNLAVLQHEQSDTLKGTVQSNSLSNIDGSPTGASSDRPTLEQQIRETDIAIKKADESSSLETLQSLFQKKAQLIFQRDQAKTLEYAYCLHFRAQVLEKLHRNQEAAQLEAEASKLRDELRRLSDSAISGPEVTPSTLSEMNFTPAPMPSSTPITPVQTYYPSTGAGGGAGARGLAGMLGGTGNAAALGGMLNGAGGNGGAAALGNLLNGAGGNGGASALGSLLNGAGGGNAAALGGLLNAAGGNSAGSGTYNSGSTGAASGNWGARLNTLLKQYGTGSNFKIGNFGQPGN